MNSLRKMHKSVFALSILLTLATSAICIGLLSEHKSAQGVFALSEEEAEEREEGRGKGKKPGQDQPDKAAAFRRLQMQDENGVIPPDVIEKAIRHVRQMKLAQPARLKARQQRALKSPNVIDAAGIEPESWTWLGPGNIGGANSLHRHSSDKYK